ncbi:MAG: NrfD/PsrC family molybdoenzyme membrane anchor subunit [Bacteroidales bacterium]|jgi:formate-dependent nitrite reductase membrane component NrfD|nr:NrfD/PsrC family molybdoenzyme membrane anchor subunit [Bacteroidales bacterium]
MNEELIISGRSNYLIDPHLHIWHWPIPVYLFLGGLAAGILFFASLYFILGKEKVYPTIVRKAVFITPVLLLLGLLALFYDLNHKAWFWQLYTTIRIESPMSWGAWTLMVVTPAAFIWSALHIKDLFPRFDWPYRWLHDLDRFFNRHKLILAWVMLIFSVILGIYTGILLSAFNARPLWNTSILGPLFLASGMSAGAAAIILMSKDHAERLLMTKIDLVLLGVELFFIIHMFMGFLASTQVQIDAASLFLGGPYTMVFWIFVVILGIIIPALLDFMELRGFHIPALVPGTLVLFGSLMLRLIIVFAGQESRWLY